HTHVGSVHAPDAEMALRNARDVYTRRQEGVSIWVVPAAQITASSPDEKDAFFDPAADKIYRHPTFYAVPEGANHLSACENLRCGTALTPSSRRSGWANGPGTRTISKRTSPCPTSPWTSSARRGYCCPQWTTKTGWRTCGRTTSSATACWSSCPTATSP